MYVVTARFFIRCNNVIVFRSTPKIAPCPLLHHCHIASIVLFTLQAPEQDSSATNILEARRIRRQINLDMVEIPDHFVTVTDELLGKGGFGSVYMADYNGRNAAAKVRRFTFKEIHKSPRWDMNVMRMPPQHGQ